jgi:hypothetical protein
MRGYQLTPHRMQRVPSFSPTPPQPQFQPSNSQHMYYTYNQMEPQLVYPEMITPHHPHPIAQGRMALPMSSSNSHLQITPHSDGNLYLPDSSTSPFGHHPDLPMSDASPLMMAGHVSPTDHLDMNTQRHNQMMYQQAQLFRQHQRPQTGRPQMQRNHTIHMGGPPRPSMNRQTSLQIPGPRSASPHMMGGDIFDPTPSVPIARRMSNGFAETNGNHGFVMPPQEVS